MRRDHRRWSQSLNDITASHSPPAAPAGASSTSTKNTNLWSSFFDEQSGDNVVWETHKVTLSKAPVFGFGIAVSGGCDSPHFANGDPSIAISDVLKAGPAEGRLQINDRIVSVNGFSLENVDHATAISVLRDSGNTVILVVRRRVVLPMGTESETPPLKVTLSRKNRKDEFGVVLGCRFYIREVQGNSLAAHEGGLKEGDTVLKINNTPVDNLSLVEAKKLLEKSKDKLQLIVTKKRHEDRHKRQNSQVKEETSMGYDTLRRHQDKDDVNIYRPSVRSEEDIFKPGTLPREPHIPPGAYPNSEHTRYDGRYVYDHEAPPRPPLPSGFQDIPQRLPSPSRDAGRSDNFYGPRKDQRDDYYSDRENLPWRETRLDYDDRRLPAEGEDEVFSGSRHEERYVGKRKDIRSDPRRVSFIKDKAMGLGLRLAGGNATGIFIASVQPGSAAEAEGLVEGDEIIKANDCDITGLSREEAVSYLTSLDGQVTLTVQYRKEEYDRIMTSHEAGDSFYIKTHFRYEPFSEAGEHSFDIGDVFHVKDTLFRGVGGSWLAIRLNRTNLETKKGTIPNKQKAEQLAQLQQDTTNEKENFPAKGRGSLFKRKAARRAKSLGRDHWEEVIFTGLTTKFAPYERVSLSDPGFSRPIVIFGAVADIARERLLASFPDRYESPQTETGQDDDKKNKSGIIRLGAIRKVIAKRKNCLLDVTPHHVDRLNYAQYYPIVIYLKAENKQVVKDLRSRWKATSKNPKKLFEHNEKLEKMYSHLFTATLNHNSSDNWYSKLCECIESQQKQPVWMSDKKPEEDISDDFLFPMPNRLSFASSPESELDLSRPLDDFDVSPMQKKRLVRSSSDPSINTTERIPGIPPYPSPPSYQISPHERYWHPADRREAVRPHENEWHGSRPEDRYYPSYYADDLPRYSHNRSNIDPYATLTPSERLRNRMPEENHIQGGYDDYSPRRERFGSSDVYHSDHIPNKLSSPLGSPHPPPHNAPHEHRGHNDSSSHSSDSYSKYVSHPANKHDDSKLREKFGGMGISGRERSPGHDPYRFTRSTANPVSTANIDKAKLSDLSAKYRKEEPKGISPSTQNPGGRHDAHTLPNPSTKKKREPPPVPAKTYTLKERGIEPDEQKMRNYENSNRGYNYSDVYYSSNNRRLDRLWDNPLDQDHFGSNPHNPVDGKQETPYEYVAVRNQNGPLRDLRHRSDNHLDRLHQAEQEYYSIQYRDNPQEKSVKAFANQMYMDQRELDRLHSSKDPSRSQNGEREFRSPDIHYARPRTDDEQLRELHKSRLRAKSEPGLADLANPNSKSQKHISWNLGRKENFESYKKLITPGFYGSKKLISRSQEKLSWEPGTQGTREKQDTVDGNPEHRSSAFEAYRKQGSKSSFGTPITSSGKGVLTNGPSSMPDLSNGAISPSRFPPPPPPPPPPLPPSLSPGGAPFGKTNPTEYTQSESEARSDSGETSDSVSTPDTVIYGGDFGHDIDENHTVVATARGVYSCTGGVLESKETGVSIVIPKGAIEEGVEQEIYFKVCRDNSILPPLDTDKGETLLSPLVMCGPHGLKFLKPVELRLPHCASVNPESWSFALKSSDSPSGHPTQWQNMSLAGMDGVTQGRVGKNSVSVLVDHF